MNKFFLTCSLLAPTTLLSSSLPTVWDTIRISTYNDLDKAEYFLNKYPHPCSELKDKIWLLMRNGFRHITKHYAQTKKQYGTPTKRNAISIIESNVNTQRRWARIFEKAVAKNIGPVIDDELCAEYLTNRTYQQEALTQARSHEQLDPE